MSCLRIARVQPESLIGKLDTLIDAGSRVCAVLRINLTHCSTEQAGSALMQEAASAAGGMHPSRRLLSSAGA